MPGTAASHPAVLPVPSPMTSDCRTEGRSRHPRRPPITWVGASPRAFPSILPFRTRASPALAWTATLLSTPSRSQKTDRLSSLSHARRPLAPGARTAARPAPMPLWRHAWVGPSTRASTRITAAHPRPMQGIAHAGRGRRAMTADMATRASSQAASRQQPGAVSSGSRPKPPARAPVIAARGVPEVRQPDVAGDLLRGLRPAGPPAGGTALPRRWTPAGRPGP